MSTSTFPALGLNLSDFQLLYRVVVLVTQKPSENTTKPTMQAGTEGGHRQGLLHPRWVFYLPKLEMGPPFICGHPSHVKVQPFAGVKVKAATSPQLF